MSRLDDALRGVDVYHVGLLSDLKHLWAQWRLFGNYRTGTAIFLRRFARNWRRRSYWNGYLAEATGRHCNAGHGWTRKRALASLHREIEAAARSGEDAP